MKLYFVRHGESEDNANGIRQTSDSNLSKLGLKQAKILSKRLSSIPVDILLSSTFARARQTAEIISNEIKKEAEYSSLFVERKRPTELEGKPATDLEVIKITALMRDHTDDINWHHSDEENFFDIKKRAIQAVQYLQSLDKENILVVTHGTIMKTMLCVMMLGEAFESTTYYQILGFLHDHNTGITWCEYDGSKWKLQTWNDYSHLG